MIALPENWSDWEITGELGRGSYSVVYEAVRKDDPSICCAIKLITVPQDESELDELVADGFTETLTRSFFDEIVQDFTGEIRLMEQLKGMQNIVSIEDYKVIPREDGIGSCIFIRMERLKSLEKYISDKKLSEEEILRLGVDICTALEFCRERQIIHRDIKPANIFVNDKLATHVFWKLGDFGIARNLEGKTMGMSAKGTPNYMAPEVAASLPYDATADIYSLGLTMYWLLNGCRLPFFPRTQLYSPAAKREALQKRLSGEPLVPPADGSPETCAVLLKACAFKPEDRYRTATEMKKALLRIQERKEQLSGRPEPETVRGTKPESAGTDRTGKWRKPAAILAAAIVLGSVGWLVFRPQDQHIPNMQPLAEQTVASTPAEEQPAEPEPITEQTATPIPAEAKLPKTAIPEPTVTPASVATQVPAASASKSSHSLDFDPVEPVEWAVTIGGKQGFDDCEQLMEGVFYYFDGKSDAVEGWRKFVPKKTGLYSFYVRQLSTDTGNWYSGYRFGIRICDQYGTPIDDWKIEGNSDNVRVPQVWRYELEAGRTYYFKPMDSYGSWCRTETYFAVCSPTRHIGALSDETVMQEPTETEPGYKAQRCLLCGREVNITEIPALDDTPENEAD